MSMQTLHATELHMRIGRRPHLSMVGRQKIVPIAKTVFNTAASSWDTNADRPTELKITYCIVALVLWKFEHWE